MTGVVTVSLNFMFLFWNWCFIVLCPHGFLACHASDSGRVTSDAKLETQVNPAPVIANNYTIYNKEEEFIRIINNLYNETQEFSNFILNKTRAKYPCIRKQITEDSIAAIRIINTNELLEIISVKNATNTSCAFVMFYAPWCKFSAESAPYMNAIGRAYPGLDVLAVDTMQFNNLNARYGTVAVPNVLLFYKGKPVMRFNYSRTFENFRDFIQNNTGLQPELSVEVLPQDYEGPLPSIPTKEPDYILWFSIAFIILFTIYIMYQHCGHVVARLHQEMVGDVHEHID